MENKDTNTDFQKVVSVGDQNREIVEITIRNIFIQGVFKYHLKKISLT